MVRTTFNEAFLIGLLTALASFCALKASAEQPAKQAYSVVAQSSRATAATGRRPLGQRIAASNLPILIPAGDGCSEHGCPVPGHKKNPLPVEAPIAEASEEPAAALEESAAALEEPKAVETTLEEDEEEERADELAASATPSARPPEKSKKTPATRADGSLLERVKNALAAKRPTAIAEYPPHLMQHPIPKPVPQTPQAVQVADEAGATAAETDDETPVAEAPPADAAERPAAESVANPLAGVPARLEFDVRESRSRVSEGEQVVMRIAVRNVGGEPAKDVTATLFFADGMEPVQAIGHSAEVYPGEVRFGTVRAIPAGESVDLLVTAIGTRAGSVTYRGELECSQLGGRIAREGAVTIRPRKAHIE
jgi:hypothetical protein